jgi:hypothetical protein
MHGNACFGHARAACLPACLDACMRAVQAVPWSCCCVHAHLTVKEADHSVSSPPRPLLSASIPALRLVPPAMVAMMRLDRAGQISPYKTDFRTIRRLGGGAPRTNTDRSLDRVEMRQDWPMAHTLRKSELSAAAPCPSKAPMSLRPAVGPRGTQLPAMRGLRDEPFVTG